MELPQKVRLELVGGLDCRWQRQAVPPPKLRRHPLEVELGERSVEIRLLGLCPRELGLLLDRSLDGPPCPAQPCCLQRGRLAQVDLRYVLRHLGLVREQVDEVLYCSQPRRLHHRGGHFLGDGVLIAERFESLRPPRTSGIVGARTAMPPIISELAAMLPNGEKQESDWNEAQGCHQGARGCTTLPERTCAQSRG